MDKEKIKKQLIKTRSRFEFKDWTKEQQRTFALFAACLCLVLLVAAVLFFFAVLKGAEQVLVPDVRGKDLADALVVLQEKELYPRLTLKFTDNPQDRNRVLEQSPGPGSIVKAGRRVKLTVSRGAVLDRIDNYVGKDLENVKLQFQSLFASSKAIVTVMDPALYRFNDVQSGTILEQKPLPGTEISGPTVLEFVVSKGPESRKAQAPDFMGKTIREASAIAETASLVVDFSMRQAKQGEPQGKVVEQRPKAGTETRATDRMLVVLTAPAAAKGIVYGIYKYNLPTYPYPVPLKLESAAPSGQRSLLIAYNHPGGLFSLPFSLPSGSSLVLTVLERELSRTEVME
ncbi:MAG: PASTA domain-containing protein [Spirochaetes bacterium]|nr:PASTA domain-containing protein [Spirochaetota bacterium]